MSPKQPTIGLMNENSDYDSLDDFDFKPKKKMKLRNINEDYILFDSDDDVERSYFKRDSTGSYILQPGQSINYESNEETEVFINGHATPASPATNVNDATTEHITIDFDTPETTFNGTTTRKTTTTTTAAAATTMEYDVIDLATPATTVNSSANIATDKTNKSDPFKLSKMKYFENKTFLPRTRKNKKANEVLEIVDNIVNDFSDVIDWQKKTIPELLKKYKTIDHNRNTDIDCDAYTDAVANIPVPATKTKTISKLSKTNKKHLIKSSSKAKNNDCNHSVTTNVASCVSTDVSADAIDDHTAPDTSVDDIPLLARARASKAANANAAKSAGVSASSNDGDTATAAQGNTSQGNTIPTKVKNHPEFKNFKTLVLKMTSSKDKTMNWLKLNNYVAQEGADCPECQEKGGTGKLNYHKVSPSQRRKMNVIYTCSGSRRDCKKRYSPFKNTFFDGIACKLPAEKVIELIYFWAKKYPVNKVAKEVEVHPNTVIDYFNYLREVCTVATLERGDDVIGGENLTVEIDESKFFKRKYNRGRLLGCQKDGWVFGGICRETKEIFMVRVPDRTRSTLYKIIKKHIRPGTRIISDEWAAYQTLSEEGYTHDTICHKRNFVNPKDPSIHTQNIECQWRYAKKNYPDNSTSKKLRDSYLQEFLYRRKHGENVMNQILHDIQAIYKWSHLNVTNCTDSDTDTDADTDTE